jgi:hypothetical protein
VNTLEAAEGTAAVPHPLVNLIRRFAVDWIDRADTEVCPEIMDPGYTVSIGGHVLEGRDSYLSATIDQLHRFPGLITVHDPFVAGDRVAMRFAEHGPSARDESRQAAWTGIGLFWWNGSTLTHNVTEEDYFARCRQLADGSCDPVEGPMPAPWAVTPRDPDHAAEAAARDWLDAGDLSAGVVLDDGWTGRPTPALLEVTGTRVEELFSAGNRVAFHAMQSGRYFGGLPRTSAAVGRDVELSVVGMVSVEADGTVGGRAVRDRLGLRRRLRR